MSDNKITSVQKPLTLFFPIRHDAVYQLRAGLVASEERLATGADAVGTIHFVRLVFVPNTSTLALVTTYDGDFESYILAFTRNEGIAQTFNGIFEVFDDYLSPPSLPPAKSLIPVTEHADAFVEFVRYYDATNQSRREEFAWFSSYPDQTVRQIRANAEATSEGEG